MANTIYTVDIADIDSNAYHICANRFSWNFEDLRFLKLGVGKCVKSSNVDLEIFGEAEKWQVLLYPDGFSERVKGYFSLWVKKLSDIERNVSLCCEIYNTESKLIVKKWTYDTLTLETVLGWTTFCKRDIIEQDEAIKNEGTFRMDITVAFYTAKKNVHQSVEDYDTDKVKRSTDVCRSLKNLLTAETFSDLTIVAGGEEFKAHKAILGASSEVFHQLLQLKSKMEDSCKLIFDDLSKEAVKEMIRFIYAGEMGDVSFKVAYQLLYAASKYQIRLLKEASSKILANNLNQDNVLRVLSLADQYIDDTTMELKEKCLLFIKSHSLQIQKQKDWNELLQNDPKSTNTVVEAFARRRETI